MLIDFIKLMVIVFFTEWITGLIDMITETKKMDHEKTLWEKISITYIKVLKKSLIVLAPVVVLEAFLEKGGAMFYIAHSPNAEAQNYIEIVFLIISEFFWFELFKSYEKISKKIDNLPYKQKIGIVIPNISDKIIFPVVSSFIAVRTAPLIYSWLVVQKYL